MGRRTFAEDAMTCQEWQTQIALYAGGDLDPAEAATVQAHIAACAECERSLAEFENNHEAMRAMWSEPLPQAALDGVRGGVLRRLRRPAWPTLLKYAAAVVLVVAGAWAIRDRQVETPSIQQAKLPETVTVPATIPERPVVAKDAAVKRARRKIVAVKSDAKPEQKRAPVLIRLATDDPNVVIYLISD